MNCSILGSWSWGTALAQLLAINANDVKLYSITEKDVLFINDKHENPAYLPGITLSDRIEATLNMEYAVKNSDIIFFVVPSKSLVICLNQLKEIYNWQTIVLATKWWDKDLFCPLSYHVNSILWDDIPFVVLSWSSHAEEVANNMPTGVTLAWEDLQVLEHVKSLLQNDWFRCSLSSDLIWVQLFWAFKNLIALTCWLVDGLWYWANTRALLFTEGISEICKIWEVLWIDKSTLISYAWLWDLYVTSTSSLSRNRTAWHYFSEWYSREEIVWRLMHMIVEWVFVVDVVEEFMKKNDNISLPLFSVMVNIINHNDDPKWSMENLFRKL